MYAFAFVAVSLALVLGASAQGLPHIDFFEETGECVPNQSFIDKCNTCHCSPSGRSAACTLMACEAPQKPRIDNYEVGRKCPAGKTFYDDCNACVCDKSGVSAHCTLMACPSGSRPRRSVQQNAPRVYNYTQGEKCPAPYFYDSCNACICNDDGFSAACTFELCSSETRIRRSASSIPHIDNFGESQECTPGQSFRFQCNTCRCAADGKSAACTMIACLSSEKIRIDNYVAGQKCPAGKTFYDRCNACQCSTDGLSAKCTLLACPDLE